MKKAKKIVVIGGGTGTYTVLSGLKKYPADLVDISAVVTMADSGGSTGRLRDEFGYLPVGDVRQALVALSDDDSSLILRKLLTHRFDKGKGLEGHNFGNLLLVALTDIFGDELQAIKAAEKILHISGRVFPVTSENTTLIATFDDGTVLRGEAEIDEPDEGFDENKKIVKIALDPTVHANEEALQAIRVADLIVLGPGDLYTSILPNILAKGVPEALCETNASLVYTVNLMTRFGQTHEYTAQNFVDEVERYINRPLDFVLVNNTALPSDMLKLYALEKEHPVRDDLGDDAKQHIIRTDLLSTESVNQNAADKIKRSLMRHDPDKLAKELMTIFDRTLPLFEKE